MTKPWAVNTATPKDAAKLDRVLRGLTGELHIRDKRIRKLELMVRAREAMVDHLNSYIRYLHGAPE